MKKIGLVALFALLLAACDDGGEKKAQLHLQKAETALKQENFNEAKLQIDSIRILYPKAFEARKQGIRLMQQVDLKEQQKSLVYLDSMMQVKQAQLDSIKGNFVLEKDTAYQEVGNYFYPTQTVEKNIGRSFLRGQVNEQGEMSITSIYCAGGKLHHAGQPTRSGLLGLGNIQFCMAVCIHRNHSLLLQTERTQLSGNNLLHSDGMQHLCCLQTFMQSCTFLIYLLAHCRRCLIHHRRRILLLP